VDAFRGAQKADPDSPTLWLNEITRLLGEDAPLKRPLARASMWRGFAARIRDEDWMESLEAAAQIHSGDCGHEHGIGRPSDVDRLRLARWLCRAALPIRGHAARKSIRR